MERIVTVEQAKKIFGKNFIGWDELHLMLTKMNLLLEECQVPEIGYSISELEERSQDYILVLGIPQIGETPLSINTIRKKIGIDPDVSEPCLYNQDWYMNEDFIHTTLEFRWYLLRKDVLEESRAVQPTELLAKNVLFPSAILCVYTFFAYYYANAEMLWYHDFVWCNDIDHNGDRIYVGKYHDIDGVNKNGFSIHRNLELRSCYASILVK